MNGRELHYKSGGKT